MVFIFKKLIPVEKAQRIIMENVEPIRETYELNIDDAVWHVLAEDIFASIDLPTFDRATQDGFAVRYEDISNATERNPVKLKIAGYIKTGYFLDVQVKSGEAYRIDTGAPIPRGADTVVPIEYTSEEDGYIFVYKHIPYGSNIQGAGGDIAKGELVLSKNTLLTPRHIGALAGIGLSKVNVYRRPKVAVFSIGDELVSVGEELSRGKIYDINIHTISALVKRYNAEPLELGIARDNTDDILELLERGIKGADLVISTGGSSVGQSDFIRQAAESLGAKMLFHGVMSKPGKPVFAAKVDNKLYLGLPGNPTSAIISFMLYGTVAINKLLNVKMDYVSSEKIRLATREFSVKGRRLYKSIALKVRESGYAYESFPPASESISTLFKADAYFVISETVDFLDKGDEVEVFFFDGVKQLADIVIVGVYSPALLKKILGALDCECTIKYVRRNSEAAYLAYNRGFADIAILTGKYEGNIHYKREIVLVGREEGIIFTAYSNFENTKHVWTHQSAIMGVINGTADGAIVPRDIAELYEIPITKKVGEEELVVMASDKLKQILESTIS